ncbi:MAG: hypothetical protein ACR2P0_08860 [Acidimicrobiales bacterium]
MELSSPPPPRTPPAPVGEPLVVARPAETWAKRASVAVAGLSVGVVSGAIAALITFIVRLDDGPVDTPTTLAEGAGNGVILALWAAITALAVGVGVFVAASAIAIAGFAAVARRT